MNQILVDLQANLGTAGQQGGLRVLQQVVGQRSHTGRSEEGLALI